jgi:hypothetical protein
MSLLATASPWNTSEDTDNYMKRTPTIPNGIRKTVRNRAPDPPAVSSNRGGSAYNDEPSIVQGSGNSNTPMSLDELQNYNTNKQNRVHQLLDKITQVNSENGQDKMGQFVPLGTQVSSGNSYSQNDLLPKLAAPSYGANTNRMMPNSMPVGGEPGSGLYMSNDSALGKYTNYQMAHNPRLLRSATLPETSRYYAGRENGNASIGLGNDERRLMEKINYMIRLLEEQQMEKTDNIVEEFVLYSMLGVFVIYVVDSFSRAGKYMR